MRDDTMTWAEVAGRMAVTEYWYTLMNADRCPSGRAYTVWTWTGHGFAAGHTTIRG